MRCIADANVLLPLLTDGHAHRAPALKWWDEAVPATHARYWRANVARREPSPDLWTDAWLAALAQAADCEMITFDKGFRSFRGLKLRLLSPSI